MRAVFVVTERKNFDIMKRSGQIPVESLEEAWQAAKAILAEEGKEDYTIASCLRRVDAACNKED